MRIMEAGPATTTSEPIVRDAPTTNGHSRTGYPGSVRVHDPYPSNGFQGNGNSRHTSHEVSTPPESSARQLLALLRLRQWVKNGFVAAPLFLTPWALAWDTVLATVVGIAAFCAVASAVYIMNDYVDRDGDREHPTKRQRPLAAQSVSIPAAFATFVLLLASGFTLALSLSVPFALVLAGYFALNVGYSAGLKNVAIADVMIIALGFVLRVEAGAMLIGVPTTEWITIMTGLLALFIALGKRRDDLVKSVSTSHRSSLAGYNRPFLDNAMTAVLGALLVTYVIYTTDAGVMMRMESRQLFYTTPFVAAGIMRYLQIMFVERQSGDPTELVWTDRFLQGAIMGWAVCFGLILYYP